MHQQNLAHQSMNRSMKFSVWAAIFLLGLKLYAYWITHSTAVLSDAAESVIHIIAVFFAAYSLRLSLKPPTSKHTYGFDRISFFSAGFEGALIIIAALFIFYESFTKVFRGGSVENINSGVLLVLFATLINGLLGWHLVRTGKKNNSLVLKADGLHILADSLTSLGAIVALLLVRWTGWFYFDPIIASLIALNILWTGYQLTRDSVQGLMDRADPKVDRKLHKLLGEFCSRHKIEYHRVRHRKTGIRIFIEMHLMFPDRMTILKAHEVASELETEISKTFEEPVDVLTHLEPFEAHGYKK